MAPLMLLGAVVEEDEEEGVDTVAAGTIFLSVVGRGGVAGEALLSPSALKGTTGDDNTGRPATRGPSFLPFQS